ncbi:MAG: right-handed parallel beta-helix repeat-containing protein, partial [Paludibacteraceae bacterium]|nr:right-handed parallel beta-helix repeat-containing protein [Paludibacteraceae bacterium]
MKRFLLLLTLCAAVLCASAKNKYVIAGGAGTQDGSSWANAAPTIGSMTWSIVSPGDTMFVAEGVYNEAIALSSQNGTTYLGGYKAETGERNPELYETILDGTDLNSYVVVKYDNPPAEPMTIDGFIIQNAKHGEWDGGAVFMRGNMTLSNCIIRNCETTGNSYAGGVWLQNDTARYQGVIRNCIFENCVRKDKTSGAGAIYMHDGGIVENCIIRNCQGGVGGIYNASGIVRNCVLYNNLSDYNACLNGKGTFINNTVCNNQGAEGRYAGCRIEGTVYNSVFWGNQVSGTASATNQNY